MRSLFFLLIVIVPGFSLHGDESPEQLALILEELRSLKAGMERLEQRLGMLESHIVDEATQTLVTVGDEDEQANASTETLIDRIADAMAVRDERVHFPWMDTDLWNKLEKGMTPEAVKALLGDPTLEDPSLHKRIDWVYTYRGTSPKSGKKLVGKVRFNKGELVSFDSPG